MGAPDRGSEQKVARRPTRLPVQQDLMRERANEHAASLAAIVDCSPDAMYSSRHRQITSWNRGAEALYGYSAAEVAGQSVDIVYPPGRDDELADISRRIAQGEAIPSHRTVRRCKDGWLVQVWQSAAPQFAANGDHEGSLSAIRLVMSFSAWWAKG